MLAFVLALPFVVLFLKHPDGAYDLLALILAFTGGIYFGAALNGGTRRKLIVEGVLGWSLVLMAALALWWTPYWLAAGFIIHGVWDLVHHTGNVEHGVRRWFPPFCAAWDWAVAALVLFFS